MAAVRMRRAVAQVIARPVRAWDAQRLGVHRAISTDAAPGQAVPELTVYVQRDHDVRLRELLSATAGPVMVVLVGASSTGKTRAAFEAVRQCLPEWSLVCPVDAADLLEQVHSGAAGPETVLWLNETQLSLRSQPDVAVALRRLLGRDEPVVVISTMWPEVWKELTSAPDDGGPDVNHQARELLLQDADRVDVPETFAGRDLVQLNHVLAADPRLATSVMGTGLPTSALRDAQGLRLQSARDEPQMTSCPRQLWRTHQVATSLVVSAQAVVERRLAPVLRLLGRPELPAGTAPGGSPVGASRT